MLTAPADALYVYANSVKIVQEFFYMRLGNFRWVVWERVHPQHELCKASAGPHLVALEASVGIWVRSTHIATLSLLLQL